MSARKRSEPAGLASASVTGMALPLLPTLFVAVLVAAMSLICREPAATEPAPIQAAAIAAQAETASTSEPSFVPASLAFSLQFPMAVPVAAEGRLDLPRRRPAAERMAAAPRRPARAAPAPEQAAAVPARTEQPHATAQQVETALTESDEDALPGLALPFAPTLRAISRARDFVGAQGVAAKVEAVALGDMMMGLVGRLR